MPKQKVPLSESHGEFPTAGNFRVTETEMSSRDVFAPTPTTQNSQRATVVMIEGSAQFVFVSNMPPTEGKGKKKVFSRKLRKEMNKQKFDKVGLEILALDKRIREEAPPPGVCVLFCFCITISNLK